MGVLEAIEGVSNLFESRQNLLVRQLPGLRTCSASPVHLWYMDVNACSSVVQLGTVIVMHTHHAWCCKIVKLNSLQKPSQTVAKCTCQSCQVMPHGTLLLFVFLFVCVFVCLFQGMLSVIREL